MYTFHKVGIYLPWPYYILFLLQIHKYYPALPPLCPQLGAQRVEKPWHHGDPSWEYGLHAE